MRRLLTAVAVLVGLAGPGIAAGAPAASAANAAPAPVKYNANLAALWTTVFETPSAQNSFGTGGAAFGAGTSKSVQSRRSVPPPSIRAP